MRNNAAYLPESPIVYIILPKSIRNRASFPIFASVVCSCAQSWNVFLIVVKKVYHKYEEGEPQLCASFVDKLSAEGRTLLCVRKTYALPNESRYFA